MPRKKKPFINKKTDNIRTFTLIPKTDSAADNPEARKKLQGNYGIEFDDDYNYLQHMRNVGEISDGTTIIRYGKTAAENLLEMVHCGKASALVLSPEEVEMDAEDKEESDPEIKEVLAALDDDQAIDEDLSEELIDQLNASPSDCAEQKPPKSSKTSSKSEDEDFNWEDSEEDTDEEDESGDEEEDEDTDVEDKGHQRSDDDVRSNNSDVTDASLAAVTRRCGQLGILDEGFEKYLERKAQNLDDEDSDDFEENAEYDSKILRKIREEQETEKKDTVLMKDFVEKPVDRERILNRYAYDSSGEEEMEEHIEEVDPMAGWDCESFVHSQPSTKKFAPTVIDILPAKTKKVKGLPKESENGLEPTPSMQKASIRRLQKATLEHQKPVAILRNKDETEEEKRERKQKVKEQRKERRETKCQNKTLWQQARYRNRLELVRTDQAHLGTRTE